MPASKYSLLANSVFMDYQSPSLLRPTNDHFRAGLARARTILNAPPELRKSETKLCLMGEASAAKNTKKAPPLPVYETVLRPRVPKMPDYESFRGARMEMLMERGALQRQLRVKATMRPDQSFLHDKQFLDMILSQTDLRTTTDVYVHDMSKDVLEYIDTRNVYWQQQIPEHVQQASKSVMREVKSKANPPRTQAMVDRVVKELSRLNQMMSHSRYTRAIRAGKKLIEDLNKLDTRVPGREAILANCSSILGNAYLEKKDDKKALSYHMQDLKIGTEYNIEAARSRALDNLGRVYARIGQFQKAIQVWAEKLETNTDMPLREKVWLCHELGYCYLKLANFEKARECGDTAYRAAKEIGDKIWQLNASMLIAQAMVVSGDLYGCKQAFDRALRAAVKAGDTDAEKTVSDTLSELGSVIDSYKEREYEAKSGESSPSIERYRSRSRYKGRVRSTRASSLSAASSSTHYEPQTARPISLAPVNRKLHKQTDYQIKMPNRKGVAL